MKQEKVIIIPRWFDRHIHVREGDLLKIVLPCTLKQKATGAVFMGNLKKPTATIARAVEYRKEIEATIPKGTDFTPCITLYLTDEISPDEVVRGFKEGVWRAVKLYMADQSGKGGTTGSQHGVKNLKGRYPVFAAMEEHGIPLLGHFEAVEPEVDEFDREITSVERDLVPLLNTFPKLKVVFEHLTDGRAANFVAHSEHEIYATVTAHHMLMNRNALFTDGMNPGHWCKPVLKREKHRRHVREYVTSGNRRFGAGTDSAPHDESAKSRCYGCAAGIFTAPNAVELYTTVFYEDDALNNLSAFLSENFIDLYGMKVSRENMTIVQEPMVIPKKVGSVPVFKGGETLNWKLKS